jgi:hypothetical protein
MYGALTGYVTTRYERGKRFETVGAKTFSSIQTLNNNAWANSLKTNNNVWMKVGTVEERQLFGRHQAEIDRQQELDPSE